MNQIDITVWTSKLADKRTARSAAFENIFVGLAGRGMANSPSSAKVLYQIARDNYSELSIIMRNDIANPRLACTADEFALAAERTLSNFYDREMAAEATKIHAEVASILARNSVPNIDQITSTAKIPFLQTVEIQNARFHQDLDRGVHKAKLNLEVSAAARAEKSAARLLSLLSFFTAFVGTSFAYMTYQAARKEFYVRNRPYLALSYSGLPSTIANIPQKLSIGMDVENTGDVPAVDVIHTYLFIADKTLLGMVNAKNPTFGSNQFRFEYAKVDDAVINAKRKLHFDFPIDKEVFIKLLRSADSENSGIQITVRYCGPWEAADERPYAYEEFITPYLDGETIRYKFHHQRIR